MLQISQIEKPRCSATIDQIRLRRAMSLPLVSQNFSSSGSHCEIQGVSCLDIRDFLFLSTSVQIVFAGPWRVSRVRRQCAGEIQNGGKRAGRQMTRLQEFLVHARASCSSASAARSTGTDVGIVLRWRICSSAVDRPWSTGHDLRRCHPPVVDRPGIGALHLRSRCRVARGVGSPRYDASIMPIGVSRKYSVAENEAVGRCSI